ncbi:MAG: hypothetical protein KKF44_04310 [Nanoarchaeota archaeon]|nr:hypothetical protein [Nanoarchaeota archaeon]
MYPFATKKFILKLQKLGYKILVWTVNEKKQIRRFTQNNINGIISDYPDRLQKFS